MTTRKTKDVQDGGILLADDWELCHRYQTDARGARQASDGPIWHRCGRFYSHNTIDCALLYVADNLMKAKCRDAALTLDAAVAEWKATIRELEQTVLESA